MQLSPSVCFGVFIRHIKPPFVGCRYKHYSNKKSSISREILCCKKPDHSFQQIFTAHRLIYLLDNLTNRVSTNYFLFKCLFLLIPTKTQAKSAETLVFTVKTFVSNKISSQISWKNCFYSENLCFQQIPFISSSVRAVHRTLPRAVPAEKLCSLHRQPAAFPWRLRTAVPYPHQAS